jgi:lipopolysaccharide transport system permease protein
VQFGLYLSPVGFSSKIVPEKWQMWYSLNPMVGIIDGFRWSIIGESYPLNWSALALSATVVILLFVTGLWYFRRTERTFADVI